MENLKPLQKSIYKQQIGEYFQYSWDFDFLDLVAETIDRIDFDDQSSTLDEKIDDAIDNALIYYCDQWKIIQHYQRPEEANFQEAVEEFSSDIYSLVYKIKETR
jgi:hypothetical protein